MGDRGPPTPDPDQPYFSVYVRNLPFSITNEDLREQFARYGEMRDIYIPKDYYTGNPRGFAYVQFLSLEDAKDAIRKEDGAVVEGRTLQVTWAQGDRKTGSQMAARDSRGPPSRLPPPRDRYDRHDRYDDRDRYDRRERERSYDRDQYDDRRRDDRRSSYDRRRDDDDRYVRGRGVGQRSSYDRDRDEYDRRRDDRRYDDERYERHDRRRDDDDKLSDRKREQD